MHELKINLYKPQHVRVSMDKEDNVDIITHTMIMAQSKLKKGKKNLPVMPKLHAQAMLDLTKKGIKTRNYQLLPLATYICLHLSKENPETVKLKISDIQEDIGLSDKSITKTIDQLIELKYIKSIRQSLFYVSPRLAFYGSAIDWSLAIEIEENGGTLEDFKIKQKEINKQLDANEIKIFG